MESEPPESTIPPDAMADLEYAVQLLMSGKKDPDFQRRALEESERATEAIYRRHGVLDVAVDLIREVRDEG